MANQGSHATASMNSRASRVSSGSARKPRPPPALFKQLQSTAEGPVVRYGWTMGPGLRRGERLKSGKRFLTAVLRGDDKVGDLACCLCSNPAGRLGRPFLHGSGSKHGILARGNSLARGCRLGSLRPRIAYRARICGCRRGPPTRCWPTTIRKPGNAAEEAVSPQIILIIRAPSDRSTILRETSFGALRTGNLHVACRQDGRGGEALSGDRLPGAPKRAGRTRSLSAISKAIPARSISFYISGSSTTKLTGGLTG